MIVVAGATGHVGSKISELLLSRGQKIRVIGRSADRLKGLASKGAEVLAGSVDDAAAMTRAFQGADAAFILIPPSYQSADLRAEQNKISEALAQAIRQSGLKYVVSLSSLGAQRGEKMGPINGLHDHEERFNKLSGVNILHLRPTYFMENLMMGIPVIKANGINGSPLKGNTSLPMIATQDIAVEAAERLVKRDFKDKSVKELLGQRDVSLDEATRVIGAAIGKPDLKYVQFPYDEAEKAMQGMGISKDTARLFIEMNRAMNEGLFKPTQPRSAQNTSRTPIEEFAIVFAEAFQGRNN